MLIIVTLLVSVLWLAVCAVVLAICHSAAQGDAPAERRVAVPKPLFARQAIAAPDDSAPVS